ncbi:uncharacterized protein [Coffea arabica]|uniref:Uncharacterized protein isoform X1 n=2 Tax=Coffea arabica TaxID=13443 RepID=A0ABM4UZ73_COFAR
MLLMKLNVLELFLDCMTEPNERLAEFGIGGICNACADPSIAAVVIQCGGISLVIQCLSSPVRNTVNYALGALYYLCSATNKEETLKPEVVDIIKRYASTGAVSVSFCNMAQAFLDMCQAKISMRDSKEGLAEQELGKEERESQEHKKERKKE